MICQKILGQKWHKFWRNFFSKPLIEDVQFAGLVHHVDYRGVVGDNNWFDELHPNDKGFKAVGNIFDKKIKDITRR